MTSWGDSVSLITGGAKGMGRGMVLNALQAGGDVVAWDLDEAGLDQLVLDSAGLAGSLRTAKVDITDRDAVNAEAARVGPIDILVNNAGVVAGGMLTEVSPKSIELTMNVNALALFWTTRAFLPAMIKRNSGHLVTVASAAGLVPLSSAVAYTASKHAAVGFHDALRQELHQQAPAVKMTLVTPFFVNTGMFSGVTSRLGALLPIVEPADAVHAIVDAVEKDRMRVIMPPTAAAAYALRLIPPQVADRLLDWTGITHSMDGFTGHAAPAPKPDRQDASA